MLGQCEKCNSEIELIKGVRFCQYCGHSLGNVDARVEYLEKEAELKETKSIIRWIFVSMFLMPILLLGTSFTDTLLPSHKFSWLPETIPTILFLGICISIIVKKYKDLKELEIFLHNARESGFTPQ